MSELDPLAVDIKAIALIVGSEFESLGKALIEIGDDGISASRLVEIGQNIPFFEAMLQKASPSMSTSFSVSMLRTLADTLDRNGLVSITPERLRLWAAALSRASMRRPAPSSEPVTTENE